MQTMLTVNLLRIVYTSTLMPHTSLISLHSPRLVAFYFLTRSKIKNYKTCRWFLFLWYIFFSFSYFMFAVPWYLSVEIVQCTCTCLRIIKNLLYIVFRSTAHFLGTLENVRCYHLIFFFYFLFFYPFRQKNMDFWWKHVQFFATNNKTDTTNISIYSVNFVLFFHLDTSVINHWVPRRKWTFNAILQSTVNSRLQWSSSFLVCADFAKRTQDESNWMTRYLIMFYDLVQWKMDSYAPKPKFVHFFIHSISHLYF